MKPIAPTMRNAARCDGETRSPSRRQLPLVDFCYQDFRGRGFSWSDGGDGGPRRRRRLGIFAEFDREGGRCFVAEGIMFGVIVVIIGCGFYATLAAMIELLQAYSRL